MTTGTVEIVADGFDSLVRAVELARGGTSVTFTEPGLRAGGAFVTESFLTPFRFNVGPSLVRRPPVPSLRVLEPDPLLAVGAATLGRAPLELVAGATVADSLDASAIDEPARRGLLTGLALLLGIDSAADGSGAALAAACSSLDDLVAIEGGNGMAVAALVDELVVRGGLVIEGAGGGLARPALPGGLGVCRLFVGLRGSPPLQTAFATAVGFDGEDSLRARLDALRAGESLHPVGFVLGNAHLDPPPPGEVLGSFVWQGVLPAGAAVSRDAYAETVFAAVSIDPDDVVFRLLWLPEETGESLAV